MWLFRRRTRASDPLARRSAYRHLQEARELEKKYGPVFTEVQQTFYALDEARLGALLEQYGAVYGKAAEGYARKTLPRWRAGEVRVSGQTMTRLLDLLPHVMSAEEQVRLVRLLRERAYAGVRKEHVKLTVRDEDGADLAFTRALEMVRSAARVEIPDWFFEVRDWLQQADSQALTELVREVEQQANLARVAALMANVGVLFELQRNLPTRAAITMTFEMPTAHATIRLRARRRETMSQDAETQDMLVRMQQAAVEYKHLEGEISFMDYVLRTLTPEEQARAREMAIREGIDLQAFVQRLRVQTEEARASIQETMRTANEMKRQGHRGIISSEITSSAGTTRIEIHTDRSPIYTAVVVGAVVLVLLLALGALWLFTRGGHG